ncbi:unnamed protein product [Adineta ricciae]|uniref:Uncharacterized protein n=1 Tax=Adineta ricciae TaxID=249248 RepID=A0A815CYZ2_ADIRI|nr:unnamed protein product [Adineta ricciae]
MRKRYYKSDTIRSLRRQRLIQSRNRQFLLFSSNNVVEALAMTSKISIKCGGVRKKDEPPTILFYVPEMRQLAEEIRLCNTTNSIELGDIQWNEFADKWPNPHFIIP